MATDNYLENNINEVGCLYKYDLLKDFLQDEYRKDDYLYNFYSSCVKEIESTNLPNCIYELLWGALGYSQKGDDSNSKGKKKTKKSSDKDKTIVELRARNAELERASELLRGRLFLMMEKNNCK